MAILYIYTDIQQGYNRRRNSAKGALKIATTKAAQRAVNKYMKENYDRINLTVYKGMKDDIKTHAEKTGESVNGFIQRAITETLERDKEVRNDA